MVKKALTVSIVIPVYNEEGYIGACLDAVARQAVAPLEVIVVDNNCTDRSIEIARTYSFVTIITEKHQHQVFAQTTGFNKAKGDILGRIDADTVLPSDWTKKVLKCFVDSEVVAITGIADPYDLPLKKIGIAVFEFYQTRLTYWLSGHTMLWGANCALRAKAWQTIRSQMVIADNIWEDHEMSYWLATLGEVKLINDLQVGCSFRSAHKSFFTQLFYQFRSVRVFGLHNSRIKTVVFFFAWYTMIPIFVLAFVDRYILWFKSRTHWMGY